MASSIRDLRVKKGYRNSRDFADALGIAPSNMSRYERDPMSIPLRHVWAMADLLGCSMDDIVGREHAAGAGLQATYEALSPETQALVDEFLEFARARDEAARRRALAEGDRRDEDLCRTFEREFDRSLLESADFGALRGFASAPERRAAFEAFLRARAEERRRHGIDAHCAGLEEELREGYVDAEGAERGLSEEEVQRWLSEERGQMEEDSRKGDEEAIARLMRAYDRLHATDAG